MQKLECGICRLPFRKEYFNNEPIRNELFQNNDQLTNQEINIRENEYPQRNNVLTVNVLNNNNQRERESGSENRNHIININNINNIGVPTIHNIYVEEDKLFIYENIDLYLFMTVMLFNITLVGIGTIIMGNKKRTRFYFCLGFLQFIDFFIFIGLFIKFCDFSKYFITYYSIINCFLIYLSSIYIAIFHNFYCTWNPRRIRKVEKKEKAIIVIYINIFFPGVGTLLISTQDDFHRFILCGISQIICFILLLLSFSLSSVNEALIPLYIFGGVGYFSSFVQGIWFYEIIS